VKRAILVVVLGLFVVSQFGCNSGSENPIAAGTQTSSSDTSKTGTVLFNIVVPESSAKGSILLAAAASPTVTFSLKVINIGNSANPQSIISKTVPVTNGTAMATFTGIPACPVIGSVCITGGTKDGVTDFQGAGTVIADRENVVELAPKNSKLPADLLATVISNLVSKPDYFSKIDSSLIQNVQSALTGLSTASSKIYDCATEIFVAKASTPPSIKAAAFTKQIKQFLYSFTKYKPFFYRKKADGNIKMNISAAVNSWDWDSVNKYWSATYPASSGNASAFISYWFSDSQDTHYQYYDDSTAINKFWMSSIVKYNDSLGLVTLSEIYSLTYSATAGQVELNGSANAKLGIVKIADLVADKVLCDIQEPYPMSGTITITVTGVGTAIVTFNGTSVPALSITYSSDQSVETVKAVLDPEMLATL